MDEYDTGLSAFTVLIERKQQNNARNRMLF